tara:strand:+ start:439 stop:669 length:231 start_codon:yes stop_codon:yes gene_type:complete
MYLIEYSDGRFVDAERIDTLDLSEGIKFTLTAESETFYTVEKNLESSFVNSLQALNLNIQNIEKSFRAIKDKIAPM